MQTTFRNGKGLMEFKTITMEWKHREKAKYLTTEANGSLDAPMQGKMWGLF